MEKPEGAGIGSAGAPEASPTKSEDTAGTDVSTNYP